MFCRDPVLSIFDRPSCSENGIFLSREFFVTPHGVLPKIFRTNLLMGKKQNIIIAIQDHKLNTSVLGSEGTKTETSPVACLTIDVMSNRRKEQVCTLVFLSLTDVCFLPTKFAFLVLIKKRSTFC